MPTIDRWVSWQYKFASRQHRTWSRGYSQQKNSSWKIFRSLRWIQRVIEPPNIFPLKMASAEWNRIRTIHAKSNISSLRLAHAQVHQYCASHARVISGSKIDTLVNQNSHAAPIRSSVRGRTGFSKSRGLRASVTFFPHPHPARSTFLLLPHFSRDPNFVRVVRERLLRRLCHQRIESRQFKLFLKHYIH